MPLLVALLVVAGLALGALPSTGSGRAPAADLDRKVEEATALIDDHEGDTRLLIEAGALLNQVARARPDHARAHAQAARVVYKLGYISYDDYHPMSLVRARALAERAIELDPKLVDGYFVAGRIALLEKRLPDASRMADKIEALEPGSRFALYLLADLDEAQGRFKVALERYQVLLARAQDEPQRVSALGGIASMTCRIREDDACEAAYRTRLAAEPNSAWTRGNFAAVLARRHKYDEAIEMAESALEITDYGMGRRTLAEAHVAKGWDLLRQGKPDAAREHFEAALEADEDSGPAHYSMGAVHLQLAQAAKNAREQRSEARKAEAAFRQALLADPGNGGYRSGLRAARDLRQKLGAAGAGVDPGDEDEPYAEEEDEEES
jgi:tetratricopeptide (TPR) repeat protein